jgi:DNA-binding MarR family transcriptional regulator
MNENFGERSYHDLLTLSDEVSRIAGTLASLTGPQRPVCADEVSPVTADEIRSIIRARRLRQQYFPRDLFADPAWDMLLELFRADLVQQQISVTSLCLASAVPPTTALRWLSTLVERQIFDRERDRRDGRRIFVGLTPEAREAMHQYFRRVKDIGLFSFE